MGRGKDRLVLGSAFFKAIATKGSQCYLWRRRGGGGLVKTGDWYNQLVQKFTVTKRAL